MAHTLNLRPELRPAVEDKRLRGPQIGEVRSRIDSLLQEWEARVRPDRRALVAFFRPRREEIFLWRVRLDCGCITELASSDNVTPPTDGGICQAELRGDTYRAVEEWQEHRVVDFPADSVEPPDYWAHLPAELWAKFREAEPHQKDVWTVLLACGHTTEYQMELGEDPTRLLDEPRRSEWLAEVRTLYARNSDDGNAHMLRWAERGSRAPADLDCIECWQHRMVVAYRPLDWLVPRGVAKPPASRTPSRKALENRLRRAEEAAQRAREDLAAMDEEPSTD